MTNRNNNDLKAKMLANAKKVAAEQNAAMAASEVQVRRDLVAEPQAAIQRPAFLPPEQPIAPITYNEPAPAAPVVTFDAITKVKFMNALASAATNDDIREMILTIEGGEIVYGIFVEAIQKKLENLMNNTDGRLPETSDYVGDIANYASNIQNLLTQVTQVLQFIQQAPVLDILAEFTRKLTDQQQPRQPAYAPPYQPPAGQYVPQPQYPPNVHARPAQQPTYNGQTVPRNGIGTP